MTSAPRDLDGLLAIISSAATELGIDAYLVGGFVRDRLLDRPSKDIDLLVVGDGGTALLTAVAGRLGWSRPQVFDRFGTGQIRGDGFIVEVVRARAESYDPASRKPNVRPGTLEEDVWRRDFTINALCQTLDGTIVDVTGAGVADLRAGVLRTPLPPGETFSEDPLRMFRAARFVAQLGFGLAPGLIEAMRSEAARVNIVSIERISTEIRHLLVAPHAREGIEVMRAGGLCGMVLPELLEMSGVEQGGYHIYDVWDHTMHALDFSKPDLITRLSVLLHDVAKPRCHALTADGRHTFYDHAEVGAEMARTILERLRFSNDEIAAVSALVRLHLRPIQYQPQTWTDAAVRRLIRDAAGLRDQLLDLARADTRASSYPDTLAIDDLQQRSGRLDQGGAVTRLRSPLDGHEIMAMTGRGPGRWVGAVMAALEDAILDGELAAGDKAGARHWLGAHRDLLAGS